MPESKFIIMISSNLGVLQPWRDVIREEIERLGMHPLMAETTSSRLDAGVLVHSLRMVNQADACVVLISNYYYGTVFVHPQINPENLSTTELEFDEAVKSHKPMCVFLMSENESVSLPPREVMREAVRFADLERFRGKARDPSRIVEDFTTTDNLGRRAQPHLRALRETLEKEHAAHARALRMKSGGPAMQKPSAKPLSRQARRAREFFALMGADAIERDLDLYGGRRLIGGTVETKAEARRWLAEVRSRSPRRRQ